MRFVQSSIAVQWDIFFRPALLGYSYIVSNELFQVYLPYCTTLLQREVMVDHHYSKPLSNDYRVLQANIRF